MERSTFIAASNIKIHEQIEYKFKKCLEKMNSPQKYQYFIAIFIAVGIALNVFNVMVGSFVFMNPIYSCGDLNQHRSQDYACDHQFQCTLENSFTAVSKNNLLCQKRDIRSTIQSGLGYGYIIGRIVSPLLSDIVGRRISTLIVYGLGILATSIMLLSIQYNSQTMMTIGQVIAGIYGSSMSTTNGIYVCDFCTGKLRQFSLASVWAVWGLAEMVFYLLYYYNPGWRFYLTATLLIPICIVFILLLFFMIQSPVYAIITKKNPQMFAQILEDLSWFNKFTQEKKSQIKDDVKEILRLIEHTQKEDSKNHFSKALKRICSNKNNLIVIVCMILLSLSFIFFYFGMQGSMERQGFSFGVNMLIVGFTQFIVYFFLAPFVGKVKRRKWLFILTFLAAVVGIMFIFDFVQQSLAIQTVLVVMARFLSNFIFCLFCLFYIESLQVQIRNVSFSLIDGAAEVSRIVLPYSINLMESLEISPIIGFSIVFFIFGALPLLPMKQTYQQQKKELLQKIVDEQNDQTLKQ